MLGLLALSNDACWNIKRRVSIKEADWLELETNVGDWHHGPIFHTRLMMGVHDVPDDQISVLDSAIGLGPGGQASAPLVLIGILASRIAFLWLIGCDPEMLLDKASAFHDTGCRV